MRSKLLIGLVALCVLFAAPALAGEKKMDADAKAKHHAKKGCTHEAQACLNKMATKLSQKGWVGIEMNGDKETGGWIVTKVEPDSPALAAGLQKGDVLLAVNGVPFGGKDKEAMHAVKSSMKIGKTITYTVKRGDHKKKVDVTLGRLPEEIMAKWIGRHMLEHTTIELAQK
jgi:C-terminal processing protease CtpA/Prc